MNVSQATLSKKKRKEIESVAAELGFTSAEEAEVALRELGLLEVNLEQFANNFKDVTNESALEPISDSKFDTILRVASNMRFTDQEIINHLRAKLSNKSLTCKQVGQATVRLQITDEEKLFEALYDQIVDPYNYTEVNWRWRDSTDLIKKVLKKKSKKKNRVSKYKNGFGIRLLNSLRDSPTFIRLSFSGVGFFLGAMFVYYFV